MSQFNKGLEGLPPDILESTLPFLTQSDIVNLSQTNHYFHELLNENDGSPIWYELFHRLFGEKQTNDEPFQMKNSEEYKSVAQTIMLNNFSKEHWRQRFDIRLNKTHLYAWGCLRHSRLGYNGTSNPNLTNEHLNYNAWSIKLGVNKPTLVPFFNNNQDTKKDNSIIQISSGGFSFQILTSSGELYTTGSTYSGGHRGPGPLGNTPDYDPFHQFTTTMETAFGRHPRTSFSRGNLVTQSINITGNSVGGPHENIYSKLEEIQKYCNQTIPDNDHIKRLFTRDCLDAFKTDDVAKFFDKRNSPQFVAVSSGRSHFIGLTQDSRLFSWDTLHSDFGCEIKFLNLPPIETNPILKIGCGWDFSCIFVYNIGLIVWKSRKPLREGDKFSFAEYNIIPNTSDISGDNKILDFACLQNNTVLYITNAGDKIYMNENGVASILSLPITGKLLKITSCFSFITIFTEHNCYTLKVNNGSIDRESLTIINLDIDDEHIISLSAGDYHMIGLSQMGTLYSWGTESQGCGCLGLGNAEEIITRSQVGEREGRDNIRVLKPTKISLENDDEYVCVGIGAGGWQSAALIIKKSDL